MTPEPEPKQKRRYFGPGTGERRAGDEREELAAADAVLDRAAAALYRRRRSRLPAGRRLTLPPWDRLPGLVRDVYMGDAAAVLQAAAEEP